MRLSPLTKSTYSNRHLGWHPGCHALDGMVDFPLFSSVPDTNITTNSDHSGGSYSRVALSLIWDLFYVDRNNYGLGDARYPVGEPTRGHRGNPRYGDPSLLVRWYNFMNCHLLCRRFSPQGVWNRRYRLSCQACQLSSPRYSALWAFATRSSRWTPSI